MHVWGERCPTIPAQIGTPQRTVKGRGHASPRGPWPLAKGPRPPRGVLNCILFRLRHWQAPAVQLLERKRERRKKSPLIGRAMHIKRLTISGFKSYKNTIVDLSPATSIIGALHPRRALPRASYLKAPRVLQNRPGVGPRGNPPPLTPTSPPIHYLSTPLLAPPSPALISGSQWLRKVKLF